MSHVIGIDLGTTNCCVAVLKGFGPEVIANRQGYKTTPSMIAVTEGGERVVGQLAARQRVTNPHNTIYAAKRLIGRRWEEEEVQHALKHAAYEIIEGPHEDVRIVLQGDELSVPEVSAMLLQEMRVIAEEYLGEPVDQAVVTVPAYFNDGQRQAVRDAGLIAGLDVLRILSEPRAAALAYGFGKGDDKIIAVYDLGGGTFDISIVKLTSDGVFDVAATLGDSYLGGEDFDRRIMEWLIRGFEAEHGIDLREDPLALARLKEAAQQAKCELSSVDEVDVSLPFIVTQGGQGPLHMDYQVDRLTLEKLTSDLVTRTLSICERAMGMAKVSANEIDEVILTGGMTRMPAVQFAVAEFYGKNPCKGVHPDEVVALGAAIQAASLAETTGESVVLKDITAHSLGVMTYGDAFDVMIPANAKVPVSVDAEFTTSVDDADHVKIVVCQGESEVASQNLLLGQFSFGPLKKAPAGEIDIDVVFSIDEDGIFNVSARDKETGEEKTVEVTGSSGLSDAEIQAMMEASKEFLTTRREEERAERLRQETETAVAQIEKLVPKARRHGGMTADIARAQEAIATSRTRLDNDDLEGLEADLRALNELRGEMERTLMAE
jgi:molecular chaperone DnaK